MGAVNANDVTASVSIESSLGTASSTWQIIEPNSIGRAGAELTTVARRPMSPDRQRRKGEITNLESSAELELDFTMEHLLLFLAGAQFCKFNGPGLLTDGDVYRPTAVTAAHYAVAAGGALADGTLVYARGFAVAANNGLKVLAGGSIATEIRTAGLSAEAAIPDSQNATVEVCGVQGAVGDIQINGSGNLVSTVLDFTTLGLTVGQFIKVGGATAVTQFATAAYNGYARVIAISANLLTLDRRSWTVGAADNGATKTIQLLFGRFARQVATTNADYLSRSFQVELGYPDLDGVTDYYEYVKGNYVDELALEMPVTDIGKMNLSLVGTDTPAPTSSRSAGASTARAAVQTAAFNMASDFGRIQINDTSNAVLSTCLKDLTITIRNNISPENCLGTLGASRINVGALEVDVETSAWYDDPDIAAAVRNNTTVVLDLLIKNDDGGVYVDVPAMTVGDGTREFPVNETVLINLAGQAFKDPTYGWSIAFSIFPYLP